MAIVSEKKETSYVLFNSPYFWMKKILKQKEEKLNDGIFPIFYTYYNKNFLVCQTFILLFGNKITNRKGGSLPINICGNLVFT